jgi:hypothetical protein
VALCAHGLVVTKIGYAVLLGFEIHTMLAGRSEYSQAWHCLRLEPEGFTAFRKFCIPGHIEVAAFHTINSFISGHFNPS